MLTFCRPFPGRHYTDLVLVAVVALCTQENDVIHAGYLALALLFFRRRDALRTERNRWRCPPILKYHGCWSTMNRSKYRDLQASAQERF